MPSGQFHSIEIAAISINRAARQRRELTNIEELAGSLNLYGLIHPILIRRDSLELIAGERRLAAAKLAGWTHISVQYEDEADPNVLKALEWEENIRRTDITWQEQCVAVAEYHSFRKANEPDWTHNDTADALGIDQATVTKKIAVAEEIAAGNTTIIEAPKYSTAQGIVSRANERKRESEVASILTAEALPEAEKPAPLVLCEDFNLWSSTYEGPRFNLLHCDFPYGINADKRQQGYNQAELGSYVDTEETYFTLLTSLAENLDRICQPSCHLVLWFSFKFYRETLDFFAKRTDFKLDAFPLIWTKSDNIGLLPDPERGPRRIYETAFLGARGDRKVVRAVSNSAGFPSERDTHMSVKPQPMLEHFFRMLVDGSTAMLDPTCGSGSSLRAAKTLGAERVLGLEVNVEFAERANARLK